jgi:hypothetical protein
MRLRQHTGTTKTLRGWDGSVPGLGLKSNNCRRVACPKCGARPPGPCLKQAGGYRAPHDERRAAMREAEGR